MKRQKNVIRLLQLLLLSSMLLISACSTSNPAANTSSTDDENKANSTNESSAKEQQVVTLWSWNPANEDEAKPYLEAFAKAHPDIKLQIKGVTFNDYLNALKIAMVAEEGPDLFQIQPGSMMTEYVEFTEDLSPLAQTSWGDNWRDLFFESGLDLLGTEDRLNAIPAAFAGAGYLWYNKTIFDEHKLSPPTTFEEWVTVSAQLREKNVVPYIHGGKDDWLNLDMFMALANEFGPGKVFEAEAGTLPWTDTTFIQAMEAWKQLFDQEVMQKGALGAVLYPDSKDKWVMGEAAMIMLGTWNNPHMSKSFMEGVKPSMGLDIDYEYLPIKFPDFNGDGEGGKLLVSTDGWAMNNNSNNKEAAWKVLEWFASPEMQTIYTDQLLLPSIQGVEIDDSDLTFDSQKAAMQMQVEDIANSLGKRELDYPELKTALADALQLVAIGELSPEKAMENVQKVSDALQR